MVRLLLMLVLLPCVLLLLRVGLTLIGRALLILLILLAVHLALLLLQVCLALVEQLLLLVLLQLLLIQRNHRMSLTIGLLY